MVKRDYSNLIPVEIADVGMSRYWLEKYNFGKRRLKLSDEKAKQTATRSIRVCLETRAESLKLLEQSYRTI